MRDFDNDPDGPGSPFPPAHFFSEDFVENPFPVFTQWRSAGPIVSVSAPLDEQGGRRSFWLVTQLEEAVQILKSKFFTVDPQTIFRNEKPNHEQGGLLSKAIISVDEPDHRRLRRLVSKAFTPHYVQNLRPAIQQMADDLDMVNDFAYPLPINVITRMLGVSPEGQDIIRKCSAAFVGRDTLGENPATLIQRFSNYLVQVINEKRAHPQEDLLSQLVQAEEAGDHLKEDELISMVAFLILAGHETTSSLISNGMLALFDHPAHMQRLVSDVSLVPTAVEELLRYSSPILTLPQRYATEDVKMNNQLIHKGDMVLIALGSANRDQKKFTQPEELDIARSVNTHIAFGQGIHTCLGAPLARLETDIAFTTLFQRQPNLRLNVPRNAITWQGTFWIHSIKNLPVAF
jgi:cytochrome P450